MSSKMREALREALLRGYEQGQNEADLGDIHGFPAGEWTEYVIGEIVSHYSDLEFTREDVRGMLEEAAKKGVSLTGRNLVQSTAKQFASEILSRHLGESSDDTPTIKESEIDAEHNPETPWPDPKSSDLIAEDFNLIWGCIKSWDINAPEAYKGYCGATGNHVMQILFALGRRDITDYWENGGSIPDPQHTLDREVGDPKVDRSITGRLAATERRLAAIEQRVLADGHAKSCEWVEAVLWKESTDVDVECTCGHDEIREGSK